MSLIGNNLKKLRLANNMTVEDVREYMQLGTVQSIYKWERGDGLPQADSLIALMQLYGADNIGMITEESSELSSLNLVALSQSRTHASETNKPPAMRVRVECYTKNAPVLYNEIVQASVYEERRVYG